MVYLVAPLGASLVSPYRSNLGSYIILWYIDGNLKLHSFVLCLYLNLYLFSFKRDASSTKVDVLIKRERL